MIQVKLLIFALHAPEGTIIDLQSVSEKLNSDIVVGYVTLKDKDLTVRISKTGYTLLFLKSDIEAAINTFSKITNYLSDLLTPHINRSFSYRAHLINIQGTVRLPCPIKVAFPRLKTLSIFNIPSENNRYSLYFGDLGSGTLSPAINGCRFDIICKTLDSFFKLETLIKNEFQEVQRELLFEAR